ncbi:MAG: enoyl-CoA hydratase/isomerase family protein [Chitinophagaceae bacterium]|nr:enoyl-CoA hydratase/isomerase family protein [Chitinophagaceae bacterium]
MQSSYVQYSVTDTIGVIEFFTAQHNSLPASILEQLAQAFYTAAQDSNCKVVLLKSAGERTFCAGASFDELINIETEEQGLQFFSGFANVINAMRKCPKFIIGCVQGKAVGGGVGLASACDYTLATKYAQIKLSELAVGIGPFVVGPAVERKIGTSAAYELAIDASNFRSAEWAKEKGLFVEIVENIDELQAKSMELAKNLSTQNPEAMAEIKKAFWSGTEHWDTLLMQRAAISGKLVLSDFTKEFIKKFKA